MIKATCKGNDPDVMTVTYHWKHENHVPGSNEDLIKAPVSRETRRIIHNMVENDMNWTSIKSVLRVDKDSLVDILNGDSTGIPAMLRIGYNQVYYAMRKCIRNRAMLDTDLEESLLEWDDKLAQDSGLSTYISLDDIQIGMFVYAFMHQWQLEVCRNICMKLSSYLHVIHRSC